MPRSKSTAAPKEANKGATRPQGDHVTIIGRLVADPVLRRTQSGKPASTIRVAVNAPDAEPTFHSVVVWNRTAEVVCEYLRGRTIEVVGRPQQRSYQATDGTDRTVDEIVAFRVAFFPGRGSDRAAGGAS